MIASDYRGVPHQNANGNQQPERCKQQLSERRNAGPDQRSRRRRIQDVREERTRSRQQKQKHADPNCSLFEVHPARNYAELIAKRKVILTFASSRGLFARFCGACRPKPIGVASRGQSFGMARVVKSYERKAASDLSPSARRWTARA